MAFILTNEFTFVNNVAVLQNLIGAPQVRLPGTNMGGNPIQNGNDIDGMSPELLSQLIVPGAQPTIFVAHVMTGSTVAEFTPHERVSFSGPMYDPSYQSSYYTVTGDSSGRVAVYIQQGANRENAQNLAVMNGFESVGAHWSAIIQGSGQGGPSAPH